MDSTRFDAFVRTLNTNVPRRAALGSALGAGLALVLPRLGAGDAAAKKRKKCRPGKKRCGKKRCFNLATSGSHCGGCSNACPSGGCTHGACSCDVDADCQNDTCDCLLRGQEAGSACAAGIDQDQDCNSDADCPLRSFCAFDGVLVRCSVPCPA